MLFRSAVALGCGFNQIDADTARKVPDLRAGPYARIRVSDTGEGMDEETLAHIFEPFFTTKPAGRGTGLGLSAVYGIVHHHGGAIHVLSRPGQGATFEIVLPTIAAQTVVPVAKPARTRPGSGERILAVDDEPALVRVMVRRLTLLGYSARGTSSPEEVPALLAQEDFDLVITDFNMPKMNGVELDLPDGKLWVEGEAARLTELTSFDQGTLDLLGVLLTLRAADGTEMTGTDSLDNTKVTRYRTSLTYEDAVAAAGPDTDALKQALSLEAETPVILNIDVAIGSDGVIREFVLTSDTGSDADSAGLVVDYRASLTNVGLAVDAPEPPPRDETVTGRQAETILDGRSG